MLLGAVLPLLGEAAVAAGAPGVATRAAVGVGTAAAFNKMSKPAAMAAREVQYQLRGASGEEQPASQGDPALDQLLANNDLSQFPNIQNALQQPEGRGLLQHAFGSLNGQPLEPENNAGAPAVSTQDLLTPQPLEGHDEIG